MVVPRGGGGGGFGGGTRGCCRGAASQNGRETFVLGPVCKSCMSPPNPPRRHGNGGGELLVGEKGIRGAKGGGAKQKWQREHRVDVPLPVLHEVPPLPPELPPPPPDNSIITEIRM